MQIRRLEIPDIRGSDPGVSTSSVPVTHSGGELYKAEIPMAQSMECHYIHFHVLWATRGQMATLPRTCGCDHILSIFDVLGMPICQIYILVEKKRSMGTTFSAEPVSVIWGTNLHI